MAPMGIGIGLGATIGGGGAPIAAGDVRSRMRGQAAGSVATSIGVAADMTSDAVQLVEICGAGCVGIAMSGSATQSVEVDSGVATGLSITTAIGADIKTDAEAATYNDLIWIKDRDNTNNHQLIDTVRGSSSVLQSNTTAAATTYSTPSGNSKAFGFDESVGFGLDIITWVGNGATSRTFPHNLGVVPGMIIQKAVGNGTFGWNSWHSGLSTDNYIVLNDNGTQQDGVAAFPTAGQTTTQIEIGSAVLNIAGITHVAYVFGPVAGARHFSTFTGNGSVSGPSVTAPGFRPRIVLIKAKTATGSWMLIDSETDSAIYANNGDPESSNTLIDFTDDGFDVVSTDGNVNASGVDYIYSTFA